MDPQSLKNLLEQFVLEVPALISEDLKGITKPNEKLTDFDLGREGHTLTQFGETVQ